MRAAFVFLAPMLIACSSDSTVVTDGGVDASGDVARDVAVLEVGTDGGTTRSSGCGTVPPYTASFDATTTDGKGVTRDYSVTLPSSYDANTSLALTLAYHGAGGTEASSKGFGIQNGTSASNASIFVFPQGINYQTYGVGWDDSCGGYDMIFFDHMVTYLETHFCVDTSRVFAAGFSWGCDQVTALSCCRGEHIRAVSAASCTDEFGNAKDAKTYDNLPCPSGGHTAVRFTHDSSGGDSAYAAPLFTTTSALFQSLNSCAPFTGTLTSNTCNTYSSCTNAFIECPYDKLGHATPANWGADTWAFFATFH